MDTSTFPERRSMSKRIIAALALAAAALAAPQAQAAPKTLYATVGPAHTISLKTASGARVRALAAGSYRIVVRDRADDHNFRLAGRGVAKSTGIAFVGTKTWTVRFTRGTYRFLCDPHSGEMLGSFRVR
jgi:plastocyanin